MIRKIPIEEGNIEREGKGREGTGKEDEEEEEMNGKREIGDKY